MMQIESTLQVLLHRERVLIEYCRIKLDERDYHGVADAAMDLRELAVEIKIVEARERSSNLNPNMPTNTPGMSQNINFEPLRIK